MIDDRVLYTLRIETQDDVLHFLALRVSIEDAYEGRRKAVHWFDTNRGHVTVGRLIRETETGFVWRREAVLGNDPYDGAILIFEVVALERFEREVRHRYLDLSESVPRFATDWELWDWYRREFFGSGVQYKGRQKPDGTPMDQVSVL